MKIIKFIKMYLMELFLTSCLLVLIVMGYNTVQQDISKEFNDGQPLLCWNTLIITNYNWKLVDTHLINHTIAGYIELGNCRIKD